MSDDRTGTADRVAGTDLDVRIFFFFYVYQDDTRYSGQRDFNVVQQQRAVELLQVWDFLFDQK